IAIGEMYGPAYIRFGRSAIPRFTTTETEFELGKASIFREGNDVAIIACGLLVWEALLAAEELEKRKGIKARVINMHTIKPIDVHTIVDAAKDCGAIVTAEEHQVHGGLGSAVAEVTAKNYPVPMEFVGVKDTFGGSGEPDELLVKFGLTWKEIYASTLEVIERRDKGMKSVRKVNEITQYSEK
ncbi:MAG: transketolase family protein, partial [Bacteroidota bacterium]